MKKLFILTLGIAIALCAKADINKPDFAYPRQVITDAQSALRTSQKSGDGIGTLQALMQIATANASIDRDSAQHDARRVLAVAAKEKQPQVKALMDLYAANIIHNIYEQRRYVYDRRNLPVTPRPADMTEWSGKMFTAVIDSLSDLAWQNAGNMPINDLTRVVDADDICQRYYPTLADFVASNIINTLEASNTDAVRNAIATRHAVNTAGWLNWQAQMLKETPDRKGLIYLYFNTPEEYRSNALVVFPYLAEMNVYENLSDAERLQYVEKLKTALTDAKGTWAENAVQNLLNQELQPKLTLNVPQIVAADAPFSIEVSGISNVKTLTLTATDDNKNITEQTFDINHESPIEADTTLQMQLSHGNYTLKAYVSSGDVSTFAVKAVKALPQTIYNEKFAAVHVMDAATGASLPNISVSVISRNKKVATATTDKDGIAHFAAGVTGYIRLTINGISQDFSGTNLSKITRSDNSTKTAYSITTDRPVYLPGDTVRWVGLISNPDKVAVGKTVTVKMLGTYDRRTLASSTHTSDQYGRIDGEFVIPDDVKAGTYGISCGDGYGTQASFAVGDFRPNAMRITNLVVLPRKDLAKAVNVTGKVVNYSNFGIDNATVECAVGDSVVQATTGTDGAFDITVPYPADVNYRATLSIRVVATDGSAISQTSSFVTEYPYTIQLTDVKDVYDTSADVTFSARIQNPAGQSVDAPMHWQLTQKDKEIRSGAITEQGLQTVNLSDLAAGEYCLSVAADSTNLADTKTEYVTLYNSTRKDIPTDDCIWLCNTEPITKVNDDNTISLTIGVRDDNTIIYTYIEAESAQYTAHRFDAGYHTLTVNIADAKTPGNTLRIAAVRNANIKTYEIEIPQTADRQLKLVTESFRDKIYASMPESWHFSITDSKGNKVQSAMALTMYDKRLDDLYTGRKSSLYIMRYRQQRDLYYSMPYNSSRHVYVYKTIKDLSYTQLTAPEWLYLPSSGYISGSARRLVTRGNIATAVLYAASADTEVVTATEYAAKNEAAVFAAEEEYKEEDDDEGGDDFDNIELRNTNNYVALWRPNLVSDSAGSYDINFTVPNANTTWQLQGFAWTKDGKTVDINRTFVAAKPVMVSINNPRFVRNGDKAVVAILVMNNSDREQHIKVIAQVAADTVASLPLTQRIVDMTLNAGASDIAYITLDASQSPLLKTEQAYITAKVSTGEFGDGERVRVPLLQAQTLVVDAQNFYLNPGDKEYSIDLPKKTGTNYSCSLTFTENPMWTVVESLPILTSDDKVWNTATCQASAFFAATIALGLQREHSELDLQFSTKDMQRVQKTTLQKLIDLQHSDGSWRWGTWCTVGSKYHTAAVLWYMAALKRAGYLPDDNANLNRMIERALKFYDSMVDDTDLQYTVTRSAFPNVTQSLNGKKVSDATVQWINKNWKKFDVSTKALAATALQYTGNKNMAKTLIGSLNEFGTQTKSKGFEFMNVRSLPTYAHLLHAYAAVTPTSEHVDGLRQYLIVRKQATDWGTYAVTSDIVAAMINSGTKWTVPAEGATIAVDGTPVDVQSIGRTGSITTDVTGSRLSISVNGNTPAYGAVISRYDAPMTNVAAYSDGEISIAKDMYVQRNGSWQKADTLRVGDKLKIVLTVKASRPFSDLVITDDRAATLMPTVQNAGWVYGDGISAYRENRNAATNLYVNYMSKGTYKLEYEMSVNNAGTFASGIATVTCAQAPELTAHSAGTTLHVSPQK